MKVKFDNVLVCDVVTYDFEGKKFDKLLVYEEGHLHSIGIDSSMKNECFKLIGTRSSFDTEMRSFNGKNKFTLVK